MLTSRALPDKGNLGSDLVYIAADAAKKIRGIFTLPQMSNVENNKKS